MASGGQVTSGGNDASGGAVVSGGELASGGAQGTCVPSAELCDGQDNDCNGKVDDRQDLCATGEQCHEGACVSCIADSDCADNTAACKVGACNSGSCGFQVAPAGTECRAGNICSATGSCVDCYGVGVSGAVGCERGEGCYAGRCSKPACGNGIIEAPDEACDPAVTNDYHCDPVTCQLTGATKTAFQACQTDNDCDKCAYTPPEFDLTTTAGIQAKLAWFAANCGGKEVCGAAYVQPIGAPTMCLPYTKVVQDCSSVVPAPYTGLPYFGTCVLGCVTDSTCPSTLTCTSIPNSSPPTRVCDFR